MADIDPRFCFSTLSTFLIKSSLSISIPLTEPTVDVFISDVPVFLKTSARTNENSAIAITTIRKNERCLIWFNIAINL